MSDAIEFVDRYAGNYPDPETVCRGQCEGMGCVPIREDDTDEFWQTLWKQAHTEAGEHECDGSHFVKCPDCGGTGRRAVTP